MRLRAFHLISLVVFLAVAALALGQEGHPLSGTWSGDWGPSAAQRIHLTLVLSWDGKIIAGTINPGPEATQIGSVALDVTNWTVHIEADAKDAAGKAAHISADGKIEDLSSAHRKLSGTWMQGTTKGDFRVTRD